MTRDLGETTDVIRHPENARTPKPGRIPMREANAMSNSESTTPVSPGSITYKRLWELIERAAEREESNADAWTNLMDLLGDDDS